MTLTLAREQLPLDVTPIPDQEPPKEESSEQEGSPALSRSTFKQIGDGIRTHANQWVVNQEEAVLAVTIAFLTGLRIYLTGRPGMGKTLITRVISHFLQLPTALCYLHPQVTPSQLQGKMVLNLSNNEEEFRPGPLLRVEGRMTQAILLDELNRGSDLTQTGLNEFLGDNQITVNGVPYPGSDIMTVIATGNLEEDGGTRELHSSIWDRLDCVLLVNGMNREATRKIVDRRLNRSRYKRPETILDYLKLVDNLHAPLPSSSPPGEYSPEQQAYVGEMIRQCRQLFENMLPWVEEEAREAATGIIDHFDDHKKWVVGATNRTPESLILTATAISLLETKELPNAHHVWRAARWCLGGLVPRDPHIVKQNGSVGYGLEASEEYGEYHFTSERLGYIRYELDNLYWSEYNMLFGTHPDTRPQQEPEPEFSRKEQKQLRKLQKKRQAAVSG